ncbi:myozenin-1b isoform X3 [Trichomycterus rosablanca]|uniref:myozenin-1b isoform X3 n=1 Tax=Trichomycterus rosablanca TaxID=2290929 RepID=UPI002F35CA63
MPLSGTPAPPVPRKKPSKIITDLSTITQTEEQETEASELDLGTKIKTPKEVMLEELSLMKGKGSKMFKMRQQRVEKFIVSAENLQNLQKLAPSVGCEVKTPPKPLPKPEPPKAEESDPEAEKQKSENVKTTALPFGGFDKASHLLTFEIPKIKVASEEPEPLSMLQCNINSRPSFNRTPIGWVCSEEASQVLVDLNIIPFDGETEDL